jgi:hypothetical protein
MNSGTISVVPPNPSDGWRPVQGESFTGLLTANQSLSPDEKERLVVETTKILSDCVNPAGSADTNTGLVIGYVQSGKTLSFTGLTALARDNKFQLVILLAGTTNNLVEQSFDRIRTDLEIDTNRQWKLFTTREKGFQNDELDRVKSELVKWKKGSSRAKTILIICMKQHQHLDNLGKLLSKIDINSVPTLFIDDEGDQAGLNTKAKKNDESPTYARIMALRNTFPLHSYVLYTATPQAPLLISRIDTLSPDFGSVLTPGEQYVGGQDFFSPDGQGLYVETILASEVPDPLNPPTEPPKSLRSALREFFVGVAIGLMEGQDRKGKNRSMMIHPAVAKSDHLMFARWVKQLKEDWSIIWEDENHPRYDGLISEFSESIKGILKSYPCAFTLNDILNTIPDALEATAIQELNTREKNKITSVDWKGEYSWILVGGIGLDRGFTVEGLTVSYMPRSTGVGNADNIQQRARFFGYKRSYLGLCRIYLTSTNIDAFTDYVRHEESIRTNIRNHLKKGKTLKDWSRTYFLDQSLKPTRSSVILLEMYQSRGRGGWISPDHPHEDPDILAENRETAKDILKDFKLDRYEEPGWNAKQAVPSFSDTIKLAELLPYFGKIRYKWPDDSLQHSSLMLMLGQLVADQPDTICSFYAFSGPWSGVDAIRTLNDDNPAKIKNLFQGSNAATNYPGARALISEGDVTFQLHRYDLQTSDKKRTLKDVPVFAVHFPDPLIERVWVER